jgi:predicted secreted protein with PEFG-CTERM motif
MLFSAMIRNSMYYSLRIFVTLDQFLVRLQKQILYCNILQVLGSIKQWLIIRIKFVWSREGNLIKRAIRLLVMCGLFITCMTVASSNLKPGSELEMISIGAAYGQMPSGGGNANSGLSGPPDPSNPDASLGDNSTGMSPDIGNDNNIPGQNDTLSGQNNPDAAAQIANPYYNATRSADTTSQVNTSSQTVPEFGPISIMVLAAAVVSTILVARRTRLRFV